MVVYDQKIILLFHEYMPTSHKKSSHLGIGMVIGSAIGVAAGFFLQSRKGKELTKDAEKKAIQLQGKIMKKLQDVDALSKEKYAEVVDDVLAYYEKSQEIAKKELPAVRAMLMKKWKAIDAKLKELE